jgi:hypothetical protein
LNRCARRWAECSVGAITPTRWACAERLSRLKSEGVPPSRSSATSELASPASSATPRQAGRGFAASEKKPGQPSEGRRARKVSQEPPRADPKKVGGRQCARRVPEGRLEGTNGWGTLRVVAGVLKGRDGLEHLALLPLGLGAAGQEDTLLGAA